MRLLKVLCLALACAGAACGPGGEAVAVKKTERDATRELYARNCAACHGPSGEGRQVGTLQVPTLRAGRAVEDTDARLLAQIHDGGNGMPPFKFTLTDDQIQDLLRFVRGEIQKNREP